MQPWQWQFRFHWIQCLKTLHLVLARRIFWLPHRSLLVVAWVEAVDCLLNSYTWASNAIALCSQMKSNVGQAKSRVLDQQFVLPNSRIPITSNRFYLCFQVWVPIAGCEIVQAEYSEILTNTREQPANSPQTSQTLTSTIRELPGQA